MSAHKYELKLMTMVTNLCNSQLPFAHLLGERVRTRNVYCGNCGSDTGKFSSIWKFPFRTSRFCQSIQKSSVVHSFVSTWSRTNQFDSIGRKNMMKSELEWFGHSNFCFRLQTKYVSFSVFELKFRPPKSSVRNISSRFDHLACDTTIRGCRHIAHVSRLTQEFLCNYFIIESLWRSIHAFYMFDAGEADACFTFIVPLLRRCAIARCDACAKRCTFRFISIRGTALNGEKFIFNNENIIVWLCAAAPLMSSTNMRQTCDKRERIA